MWHAFCCVHEVFLNPGNILIIKSNTINHAAECFAGDATVAAEENYEVWGQFKWGPGGQCPTNLIDKTATPQHLRAVLSKLILRNDVRTCEPHAGKRFCESLHLVALLVPLLVTLQNHFR